LYRTWTERRHTAIHQHFLDALLGKDAHGTASAASRWELAREVIARAEPDHVAFLYETLTEHPTDVLTLYFHAARNFADDAEGKERLALLNQMERRTGKPLTKDASRFVAAPAGKTAKAASPPATSHAGRAAVIHEHFLHALQGKDPRGNTVTGRTRWALALRVIEEAGDVHHVGYLYETLTKQKGDWLYRYFHNDAVFKDDPSFEKRRGLLHAMETRLGLAPSPDPRAPGGGTSSTIALRPAETLAHLDVTRDPGWGFAYRVGDAAGPNLLLDIVDGAEGVRLLWYNVPRETPITGTTDGWRVLNMVSGFATGTAAYQALGKLLSPAEWRSLWPSPAPSLLARYEARTLELDDGVVIDLYCGLVYQLALARLAENEREVDRLLADQAQIDRRREFAETLREASIVRDKLEARLSDMKRARDKAAQALAFGLFMPGHARFPSMPQQLAEAEELGQAEHALAVWLQAFPLLTRFATDEITADRIHATIEKVKLDIQGARRDLEGDGIHAPALDPWDLARLRAEVDRTLGKRAAEVIAAEQTSRKRWGWIKGAGSLALGIGLLFVPGGAFIDAVIGVGMTVKSWEEAAVLGRAANTALAADAGLVSLFEAHLATFMAVLGTVLLVVGTAAQGLRLLRKWKIVAQPFKAAQFPTPAIAKTTGDAAKNAQIEQFAEWMAQQANAGRLRMAGADLARMAPAKRAKALEELYESFVQARYKKALEIGGKAPEKITTPIKVGDPNFDPFGDIRALEGSPAHGARAEIGRLAEERFAGTSAETVQTRVRLPNGETIEGNVIHRGASADAINALKGNKYGYAEGAAKIITETTSPANQRRLHDAGVQILADLAAEAPDLARNPALAGKAKEDFATALYALFQGPVNNRGSDSAIRLFGSVMYQKIFGRLAALPHDVDIRAYALDQKRFVAWLVGELAKQGG
jgi:hypothetical protein